MAVWRREAAVDGRLLVIAERLLACQLQIALWGMNAVASEFPMTWAADIMASTTEVPVQHMVGVLACQAQFDLELARVLLPGAPDAPPLGRSPGQVVARMAAEWVLVTVAYWVARDACARGEIASDQPVHVPAVAELAQHSQAYDRMLEDLIAGRRRQRIPDGPSPSPSPEADPS